MNFKQSLLLSLVLALGLIMGGCAAKQGAETQAMAEPSQEAVDKDFYFHDIVDVAFVEQYAKVPNPEGVMIIDSRPYQPKFVQGYIPTAVSIPDSQFEKMTDKLPAEKDALLIFYCEGPT